MKYGIILVMCLAFFTMTLTSFNKTEEPVVNRWYAEHLEILNAQLLRFKSHASIKDTASWKQDFKVCRTGYKQVEGIIAYYFPFVENRMNGPAVLEIEPSDFSEINFPTGFQVLEEAVFDDFSAANLATVNQQLDHLLSYVSLLEHQQEHLIILDEDVYDIVRTDMYALVSKGISGFDSPVAYNSLSEATVSIKAGKELLGLKHPLGTELEKAMDECVFFLNENETDFIRFDRAVFLRKYFNPMLQFLYKQQIQQHIAFKKDKAVVRKNVSSFFDKNAFDPYFYVADSSLTGNDSSMVSLGKRLFNEKALSLGGRSCASCHQPEKAYTDGLIRNMSLQRDEMILRNTPTIINAAMQPSFFYDTRSASLENQAHEVLQNKDEMDGFLQKAIVYLQSEPGYKKAFKQCFPKDQKPVDQENIIKAIVAFERSLVIMSSPFDQYMRGDATAMSPQQVNGLNIFMGKAKCGTCHYMPLFNGVVPPFYTKMDTEVIGVPEKADKKNARLDPDPGADNYFHNKVKSNAFKTPTLRNIAETAPYMHNGVYKTLEEVIDFYNDGGGAGLGYTVSNQTLPTDKLQLTVTEKKDLIEFLKALNNN